MFDVEAMAQSVIHPDGSKWLIQTDFEDFIPVPRSEWTQHYSITKMLLDLPRASTPSAIQVSNQTRVLELAEFVSQLSGLSIGDFHLVVAGNKLRIEPGELMHFVPNVENETIFVVHSSRVVVSVSEHVSLIYCSEEESEKTCLILGTPGCFILSCGHAISTEGLRCQVLRPNRQKLQVDACCLCKALISQSVIQKICELDAEETRSLEETLTAARMRREGKKKCPDCSAWISGSVESSRVSCSSCSKSDFCFFCGEDWNRDSTACTSKACMLRARDHKRLETCVRKTIGEDFEEIPAVRACPWADCGTIIEHSGGCKKMRCPACERSFCFVCLERVAPGSKGPWPCGGARTICPTASIQRLY